MHELKLPKLPDRTPIKLSFTITPDLHQLLHGYAALYAEAYGREEPIAELIPAMLTTFLESDRGFTRSRTNHEQRSARRGALYPKFYCCRRAVHSSSGAARCSD